MPDRRLAIACAFITVFFWAGSFPAITLALKGYQPLPLAALRFLIASVLLALMVTIRSGLPKPPRSRHILWFTLTGFVGIAAYNYFLNTGQRTVSPGAASFLISCQPVFSALVAIFIFKESFPMRAWIGTAICLMGAAVVALGQPGGLDFGAGAPLILFAACLSGSSFALQRPLIAQHGPMASALWLLTFGAILLSPWLPRGFAQLAAAPLDATLALIFLGVFPGALAYFTWMIALAELGAPKAANLLFFMAPVTTLMSVPLLGVLPGWLTMVGGATALAGVFVVHQSRS